MVHVAQNATCKINYVCGKFRLVEGVKQYMDCVTEFGDKMIYYMIQDFLSSFYFKRLQT